LSKQPAILTLLIICLITQAAAFAQTEKIEKLPDISLKDLKGTTVNLSRYNGTIILLNFWATWCIPCRAEIPELVKWQKKYQSKGLQIIGITYPPANRQRVLNFIRKNRVNYPILAGTKKTKALFDPGETLPITVVIDKAGNIKARIEGVIFDEEFDEKIKPLLKTGSQSKGAKF